MDKYVKLRRDVERLTAGERRAVTNLMYRVAAVTSPKERSGLAVAVADVAAASARTASRRASDRVTDNRRRILVGARVRRSDANLYRSAALDSGRSLYRFVVDALRSEYEKTIEGVCPKT